MTATVTQHAVGFESLDALEGLDALCVFLGEDDRPLPGAAGYVDWRLCGRLSRLLQEGFFQGQVGDSLLVPTDGAIPAPRLFVLGVGRSRGLTEAALADVLSRAAGMLSRAGVQAVALELPAGAQGGGGEGGMSEEARADVLQRAFLPSFRGRRVALVLPASPGERSAGRGPAAR
jgi:hypothetical protein